MKFLKLNASFWGEPFRYTGALGLLVIESLSYVIRQLKRKRRALRLRDVACQIVSVGWRALPVVCCVNVFVGMILAFQLGYILELFGALPYLADIIGIAFAREMGPLLVGIVSAGFIGAAGASEIGTMVVGEELLAMRAGALSPIKYLILPRLIASALVLPLLATLAVYAGNLGGFFIAVTVQGVDAVQYMNRLLEAVTPYDVISGLAKASAFGFLVSTVACYEGFSVKGGASGVGKAATSAVVKSVVIVIVADLVLTYLFQLN